MLAATQDREEAGSEEYHGHHFGKILKEGFSFSGFERDHLYLNQGGRGFFDISGLTGIDSDTDGRGAAYGDFDNDGDYDIFVTAFQKKAHHLFKNEIGQAGNSIRVSLQGVASGRDAFGAIVRVKTSAGVLTKIKAGGSGFVSQSDPRLLFGLGEDASAEWLEVEWPGGSRDRFDEVPAGASLLVVEGSPEYRLLTERRFALPEPDDDDSFLPMLRVRPGAEFPDLTLVDTQGRETTFSGARPKGRKTLVNLWATYCVPCRREMPELEALSPAWRDAGLDVLGLSLDMGRAQRAVPRHVERLGVTYPVFTTDEAVFPALFAGEEIFIPLTYLVDGDGIVVEVFRGWSPDTRERIQTLLGDSSDLSGSR